uniref:Uncharacterized protein n=1 Tax=Tetranychus urticae TaxID=32264 RepID=T1K2F0_TETUR
MDQINNHLYPFHQIAVSVPIQCLIIVNQQSSLSSLMKITLPIKRRILKTLEVIQHSTTTTHSRYKAQDHL